MDTTLLEAGKLIARSQTIVISTHIMPDGDGLGAEIALYHYLKRIGKQVRILNPDVAPDRYKFIDRTGVMEVATGNEVGDVDLVVIVDTDDPKRLAHLWAVFEEKAKDILIIDHHPATHENQTPPLKVHTVVDEKSSSIGELLYRFFHQAHDLLDTNAATFHLTPEIALGLYVSIITDTNSFRYARTTALSHRIAADLVDYGLQPEEIYQNVYSSKEVGHLRLIGEVLSKVQETQDGKLAWVEIPLNIRKKHSAESDDTQNIVNFLLLLKSPEVLCLFREEDDGRIKVSLKSKGTVKVNDVAKDFGGGGHAYASGFTTKGSLKNIRDQVLKRLQQ